MQTEGLNTLPITPGWPLPLRTNPLDQSDLLQRQSNIPPRSNRAQSPADSSRMDCDPPKLKTREKHMSSRKESSRQLAPVFPTAKESQVGF